MDDSQHVTHQKSVCSLPLLDYAGKVSTGKAAPAKVSPGFIGNSIHNFSILGWHHHKKQRPSKHARRRAREKAAKRISTGGSQKERGHSNGGGQRLSESGYDTVGEQQASPKSVEAPRSLLPKEVSVFMQNTSIDSSLKKLLKDLQRCDVFIARSQTDLQQHCTDGERELKKVFSLLHQHLNARESDLVQELQTIRETAGSILERRKATLEYLKSAAYSSNNLDQHQVAELAQQMKQFVTDRKVDEEIGAVERFHGDVDDILPHIMGFGQVNNVRHLYTEWEENPDKIILRSKSTTTFLPFAQTDFTPSQSEATTPSHSRDSSDTTMPSHSQDSYHQSGDSPNVDEYCSLEVDSSKPVVQRCPPANSKSALPPDKVVKGNLSNKRGDSGFISVQESSSSSGSSQEDDITSHSSQEPTSTHSSTHKHKPIMLARGKKTLQDKVDRGVGKHGKVKYSPEQLKVIQDRVKESLKNQGVYLYDPITGAGPPKEHQWFEEGRGEGRGREKREAWDSLRKKKTPTQLRRERKKRQKERERRQKEMDKTASEESDGHPISPPPPVPQHSSSPVQVTPTQATPTQDSVVAGTIVQPEDSTPLACSDDSTHSPIELQPGELDFTHQPVGLQAVLQKSTHQLVELQDTTHQPVELQDSTHQPTVLQESTHQPTVLQESAHQPTVLQVSPVELQESTHQPTVLQESAHQPTALQVSVHQPVELQDSAHQPVELQDSAHQPVELQDSAHQPVVIPAEPQDSDSDSSHLQSQGQLLDLPHDYAHLLTISDDSTILPVDSGDSAHLSQDQDPKSIGHQTALSKDSTPFPSDPTPSPEPTDLTPSLEASGSTPSEDDQHAISSPLLVVEPTLLNSGPTHLKDSSLDSESSTTI